MRNTDSPELEHAKLQSPEFLSDVEPCLEAESSAAAVKLPVSNKPPPTTLKKNPGGRPKKSKRGGQRANQNGQN